MMVKMEHVFLDLNGQEPFPPCCFPDNDKRRPGLLYIHWQPEYELDKDNAQGVAVQPPTPRCAEKGL